MINQSHLPAALTEQVEQLGDQAGQGA